MHVHSLYATLTEVVSAWEPESRKALLADRNLDVDKMHEVHDGLMPDGAMNTDSDAKNDEDVDQWLDVDADELVEDLKTLAPSSCVFTLFGITLFSPLTGGQLGPN